MPESPNPEKPAITNYKYQITNKIKRQLFGILNFGHCDLFGICDLLFEIFIAET
jgi:hypothetical protein